MRLKNNFKEQILFVSPKYKTVKIAILTEWLDGGFLSYYPTRTVKVAANYSRDKISNAFIDLPELKWPPSLQELSEPNRSPPQSFNAFLETFLN